MPFSRLAPRNCETVFMNRRRLITLIQAGSLLATGWMVWSAALVPRLHRQTLGSSLLQVLGYTLLAWAWSAVVAFGLYAIVPIEDRSEERRVGKECRSRGSPYY